MLGGYILLLCVVFAIPNDASGNPDNALAGLGVQPIFVGALGQDWATLVLFISASAQFFCATSCMTSASRMTFAFSRDGAIPGSTTLKKLTSSRVPANAVIFVGVAAAILTLPALIEVDVDGTPVPLAFYAVTSIAVIGLYLAFAIPIWLRWRHGDKFDVGELEQRREVQVDEPDRRGGDRHRVAVPDDADDTRRPTRSAPSSSGSS